MNKVCLVGRLTRDVDLRQNGDSSVARFTVAVDRKYKNKDGGYDADFINVVCFSKSADFVSKYFSKGMKIGITGHIQTGSYTNKEGQKIYTFDVVADEAEFVESKNTQTTKPQNVPQSAPSNDDGFMNLPDDIDEELPFV